MNCPECGGPGRALKRRAMRHSSATYRRRSCLACGHRWSTYEILEEEWRAWRGVRSSLRRLRAVLQAVRSWVE